ncbi:MAG: OsmC family protein, partial [Atribacterota bacterium]
LEGDMVHGGWVDKEGRERMGFKQIRYEIKIKTEAPEEEVRKLHKLVEEKCPVSDMLINPTEVKGSVSIR